MPTLGQNPGVFITQMDTVYNDGFRGSFIQTYKFVKASLLFAISQEEKTASAILSGVSHLEEALGPQIFRKYVHVLFADQGSAFSPAQAMETVAGSFRHTRVFFCDLCNPGRKEC